MATETLRSRDGKSATTADYSFVNCNNNSAGTPSKIAMAYSVNGSNVNDGIGTAKNLLHPSESISAVDIEALPNPVPSEGKRLDFNQVISESERLVSHTDADGNSIKTDRLERFSKSVSSPANAAPSSSITKTGLQVLLLLAVQNCSKNLLLRFVMKEHPQFLTSAAVLGVEMTKLTLSLLYIRLVERRPFSSALTFIKQERKNTLLMGVPAGAYNLQMTLEYMALGNLDAAVFSVLVQTKLLATAGCAVLILRKKIKKVQLISLFLLTIGVMLCNMKDFGKGASGSSGRRLEEVLGGDAQAFGDALGDGMEEGDGLDEAAFEQDSNEFFGDAVSDPMPDTTKGILATLGISACSGFASVYTEKVIKAKRNVTASKPTTPTHSPQNQQQQPQQQFGLAYTQVQLASMSLLIMGLYCVVMEFDVIMEKGLWYGFNGPAFLSIFIGAIGGLIVAAVLKYADAVLKGYATAISVILTGLSSMVLFGTRLNTLYFLGIGNVICAVLLYSATDLDRLLC